MKWSAADLFAQLGFHWDNFLRQRFDGLTDDEYFWEPVAGCWTVREASPGKFAIDSEKPPPKPPPVTTIAWRVTHLVFPVLGFRANWHFGDKSLTWETARVPGSASGGLAALDAAYAEWRAGILGASGDRLMGSSQGPPMMVDEDFQFAQVIQHVSREVIHHGAEISLLRDLYLRRGLM